jgi:hypothetical protein
MCFPRAGLKPATLTAVKIVPIWQLVVARVHPASNTRFEFDVTRRGHLDKKPDSQHPALVHHT